jgi:hypothetical protein
MKVTFKDSNLQINGGPEEEIVLDLDIIPKVGDSVFFHQEMVPEIYLDFVKRHGFIVKDESAKYDDSYKTVKADVQFVHHVFKPQVPATYIGRTLITFQSGHSVEIEIGFESERSNGELPEED